MKKRFLTAALAMTLLLAGCGLNEYKEGLDDANELFSGALDAARELAGEAASLTGDAAPSASSIAEDIKSGLSEATESVPVDEIKDKIKENIKEAGKSAAESVTEAAREAAKDAASEMISKAVSGASSAASSDSNSSSAGILKSTADIELENTDGKGENYRFYYGGDEFSAIYTEDNWKIIDSYLIVSESDMTIICQALIDEHPVHGKDLVSYRTAKDMAYEWQVHNIAYTFMEEDDPQRIKAKDVDFDPKDQGLTLEEFYETRTGKKFDISDILGGG